MLSAREPDLTERPYRLAVGKSFPASPEAVFHAWTNGFPLWFTRPEDALWQPAVDSVFYFSVDKDGSPKPHYGRFLRIEPSRLVELTWMNVATRGNETVLRVELEPRDGGTQLLLVHSGFPDQESCAHHERAWPRVLEHLAGKI